MYPDPLLRALSIAGGLRAPARHLHVPKKQLGSWLDGDTETPPATPTRNSSSATLASRRGTASADPLLGQTRRRGQTFIPVVRRTRSFRRRSGSAFPEAGSAATSGTRSARSALRQRASRTQRSNPPPPPRAPAPPRAASCTARGGRRNAGSQCPRACA